MEKQPGIQNVIAADGKVHTSITNDLRWQSGKKQIWISTSSQETYRTIQGMKIYFRDSSGTFIDDQEYIKPIATINANYYGIANLINAALGTK